MRKLTIFFVLLGFLSSCIIPPHVGAQLSAVGLMPEPGKSVVLSPRFTPAHLKGMMIDPANPFKFDFIIARGDEVIPDEQKNAEYTKLVKYFLASLAVPDVEQWVTH
ncbi:MAG: hypothetical protein HQL20_11070 [Candidatus Omnitrophica bacterium]|nr:hypothetical protein [Candidatus Omnitrophota bacterium]